VDALGIDLPRLIFQMVNFLILLFLLQRLLFKPILRLMDQRATKIRESVDEAERMRKMAEELRAANAAALEAAKKEANDLINAATHAANQITEKAREDARAEAERIMARMRDEIRLERDRAIADVRHQAVDLAILAAGKVLEQSLTGPQHYQIVRDFLEKAGQGESGSMVSPN